MPSFGSYVRLSTVIVVIVIVVVVVYVVVNIYAEDEVIFQTFLSKNN